ncbi:MAG TPA: nicotinate phosphoribosyltransferase [Bacillota bacterium]
METLQQARALRADAAGRFHSATHEEIAAGATGDVYFVKTMDILRHLGLASTPVTAEVFAGRAGVLAGIEEVRYLLSGAPLEVWSLAEGERIAAGEVVLRIRGPYEAFGPKETALLGMLASASGWATAAAEVREAAGDLPVICFGARHVHPAVAPVMERAAMVGGADGASCILAAALAGIKPIGTIPHALVLLVGDTVDAAVAYDRAMPPDEPRTILVDTYKDEAEEALRVAAALAGRLGAVRLDTPAERGGVTPGLVRELRWRLDQAGHKNVRIFVSGGLTPERIRELAAAGADGFGVGSYISGARPIDMTMDLKEIDGRPVAKRGRLPGLTPAPRLRPWAAQPAEEESRG